VARVRTRRAEPLSIYSGINTGGPSRSVLADAAPLRIARAVAYVIHVRRAHWDVSGPPRRPLAATPYLVQPTAQMLIASAGLIYQSNTPTRPSSHPINRARRPWGSASISERAISERAISERAISERPSSSGPSSERVPLSLAPSRCLPCHRHGPGMSSLAGLGAMPAAGSCCRTTLSVSRCGILCSTLIDLFCRRLRPAPKWLCL
jgi:hypothetical protein